MPPISHASQDVYTSPSPNTANGADDENDAIDAEIWRFFFAPVEDRSHQDRYADSGQ